MAVDFPRMIHNDRLVDSLTQTLDAVSDPTRRSILERLAAGPAPVRDLVAPLGISQQAVSQHLARLERAGLIRKRRQGRLHICSLAAEPLAELAAWTEGYRRFWEERFQRLDAVLEEMGSGEKAAGAGSAGSAPPPE
jgi:DNA-binding transcriptional ArsR family regulator